MPETGAEATLVVHLAVHGQPLGHVFTPGLCNRRGAAFQAADFPSFRPETVFWLTFNPSLA